MVKTLLLVQTIILLLFSAAQSAPDELNIYVDYKQVPAMPAALIDEYGRETDILSNYYSDVPPMVHDGRVFVPLRTIAGYWDAEIDRQDPDVLLNYGDIALKLTLGSRSIARNNSRFDLEAAPFLHEGEIMAPLSFIGAAFDCKAHYINNRIFIHTPALHIDGRKAASVRDVRRMTIGSDIFESRTNICISKFYRFFEESAGNEVPAPEYFDAYPNLDIHNFYVLFHEISFMEYQGGEASTIKKLVTYYKLPDNLTQNYILKGTYLGEWLINDETNDKWYQVTDDNFFMRLREIHGTGYWQWAG
jgi:hypothetical protein